MGGAISGFGRNPSTPSPFPARLVAEQAWQLEGKTHGLKESSGSSTWSTWSSVCPPCRQLSRISAEPSYTLAAAAKTGAIPRFYEHMMSLDLVSSIPDDTLPKVGLAGAAVGLETRMPLLDHRVVELAWRFPFAQKSRDGQGKWILRRILERYVPREIVDRPKMGFAVPVRNWMRGELKDWADSLLDPRQLQDDGYFDATTVRAWWDAYLRGDDRWHYPLWTVMMFQGWRNQWLR